MMILVSLPSKRGVNMLHSLKDRELLFLYKSLIQSSEYVKDQHQRFMLLDIKDEIGKRLYLHSSRLQQQD